MPDGHSGAGYGPNSGMIQGFVTVITGIMMSVPIRFPINLIMAMGVVMTVVMIPSGHFTRQLGQAMGRCFTDRRE